MDVMRWRRTGNAVDRHEHASSRSRFRVLIAAAVLTVSLCALAGSAAHGRVWAAPSVQQVRSARRVPFGAFLGSEQPGVDQVAGFDAWLGSKPGGAGAASVGHTYLPGDSWSDIEGDMQVLGPWTSWHRQNRGSLLVLNVPMLPGNEVPTADTRVAELLEQGAR